jgi:hypothetical protein
MLSWLGAAAVAVAIAGAHYWWREPRARGGVILPALLRALALTLLLALLLDAPAGRRHAPRAYALLDASASWLRGNDSTAWRTARERVRRGGADSTLLFGDSVRASRDAVPGDLASNVRPAVERALAAGRPVIVVTDGEVDDPDALQALPAGSRVEVIDRPLRRDAALASIEAPRAAVSGDTVDARIAILAGNGGAASGRVTLLLGDRALGVAALESLPPFGETRVSMRVPIDGPDGARPLRAIVSTAGDAEPRNDTLAVTLEIARGAGAVFVSTSPDYDARYTLSVLRGALALPTRGFFRVAPGMWRADGALGGVPEADVRRAVREAPLVIVHGDSTVFGPPLAATRGALALLAPPSAREGDWYVSGVPTSPLAGTLSGLPWDSLPPLEVSSAMPRGDWRGLEAARARQFERRVAIAGYERPRRVVVVGASGFWRWQFRGGVGAEAFATLWGSIFDWLAEERADRRAAVPAEGVLRAGEPVRWRRGGDDDSLVVATLRPQGRTGMDSVTLRFEGGATMAMTAPLAAGLYDVTVPGGTTVLTVNPSREWLPRAPALRSGSVGGGPPLGEPPRLRERWWMYAVLLGALCGEWVLRRRLGLR